MKYDCGMIQDLLPLYKDNACSVASANVVQEHVKECDKCKSFLESLNDTSVDELIRKEKENVIGHQSKYFKRKSALAGSIVGGIFALPILICLIVNLANGQGLTWFFIVFAAMLIPSSLFVVPLVSTKNRMFLTMTSLTVSIIVLLAVCCIYSNGNWFFVAASSVLFGLTVVFGPFIACRKPVKTYLKNFKGLAVMTAYTLTFFLMMFCIGFYVSYPGCFLEMFSICIPLVLIAWALFLIFRYLPANGFVKTGVGISILSAFSYFGSEAMLGLNLKHLEPGAVFVYAEPSVWMMVAGLGIGAVITAIGLLIGRIGGKKK